eukprot:114902_1
MRRAHPKLERLGKVHYLSLWVRLNQTVVKYVKAFQHKLRLTIIDPKDRSGFQVLSNMLPQDVLFSYATIERALGDAINTKSERCQKWSSFKERVTSGPANAFDDTSFINDELFCFAKRVIREEIRPLMADSLNVAEFHMQESATLNTTRAEGGKRMLINKAAESYRAKVFEATDTYVDEEADDDESMNGHTSERSSIYSDGPINPCVANQNRMTRLIMGFDKKFDKEVFKTRIGYVSERADKVRTMTINHVARTIRCRTIHTILLDVLSKLEGCKEILLNESLDGQIRSKGDNVLYSTDMSKATDHIYQQWGYLILTTVFKQLKVHGMNAHQIARLICGPIQVRNDELKESITTNRGIMMGTSGSWFVLSVCNYIAYKWAEFQYAKLCGDDLIALCTRKQISSYEFALSEMGIKTNKEKSFVGCRGVFCERLVTMNRVNINPKGVNQQHSMSTLCKILQQGRLSYQTLATGAKRSRASNVDLLLKVMRCHIILRILDIRPTKESTMATLFQRMKDLRNMKAENFYYMRDRIMLYFRDNFIIRHTEVLYGVWAHRVKRGSRKTEEEKAPWKSPVSMRYRKRRVVNVSLDLNKNTKPMSNTKDMDPSAEQGQPVCQDELLPTHRGLNVVEIERLSREVDRNKRIEPASDNLLGEFVARLDVANGIFHSNINGRRVTGYENPLEEESETDSSLSDIFESYRNDEDAGNKISLYPPNYWMDKIRSTVMVEYRIKVRNVPKMAMLFGKPKSGYEHEIQASLAKLQIIGSTLGDIRKLNWYFRDIFGSSALIKHINQLVFHMNLKPGVQVRYGGLGLRHAKAADTNYELRVIRSMLTPLDKKRIRCFNKRYVPSCIKSKLDPLGFSRMWIKEYAIGQLTAIGNADNFMESGSKKQFAVRFAALAMRNLSQGKESWFGLEEVMARVNQNIHWNSTFANMKAKRKFMSRDRFTILLNHLQKNIGTLRAKTSSKSTDYRIIIKPRAARCILTRYTLPNVLLRRQIDSYYVREQILSTNTVMLVPRADEVKMRNLHFYDS